MTAKEQGLTEWLVREMPPGTIIGDPKWWAERIVAAFPAALASDTGERGVVAWLVEFTGLSGHVYKSAHTKRPDPEGLQNGAVLRPLVYGEALRAQPAGGGDVEPDSECKEADGCPTEKAVLQRFWREHRPDPKLCEFYDVDTLAGLLAAQEEHVLKLQDVVRRNVKPWEDTMPPTLLPKYLRESGLAAAEPKVQTVVVYGATPPESGGQGEAVAEVCRPGHPRHDSATFVRLLHDNLPDGTKLYTHPTAQASGAVTEEVAKRIYYMRRDFDLSTVERSHFWARECRDIVEALAQGAGNER